VPSGDSAWAKKMLCEGPATLLYWLQFSSQRWPLLKTHPLPRLHRTSREPRVIDGARGHVSAPLAWSGSAAHTYAAEQAAAAHSDL
jgi:hypothetical protein